MVLLDPPFVDYKQKVAHFKRQLHSSHSRKVGVAPKAPKIEYHDQFCLQVGKALRFKPSAMALQASLIAISRSLCETTSRST